MFDAPPGLDDRTKSTAATEDDAPARPPPACGWVQSTRSFALFHFFPVMMPGDSPDSAANVKDFPGSSPLTGGGGGAGPPAPGGRPPQPAPLCPGEGPHHNKCPRAA